VGFEWLPDIWWAKWVWFLLGPFVQEDLAILSTASFATGPGQKKWTIFGVLWIGVILSDLWKYYIGWFILKHPKARDARELQRIQALEQDVKKRLGLTLMSVRFVPLARIPTYAACGYFGVRYWRYAFWIAAASFAYIALAFLILDLFGAMFVEQYRWVLAAVAGVFMAFMAWRTWSRTRAIPTETPPSP